MAEVVSGKKWTPDQLKFQAWLALPASARSPKTQRELARQLEYHEITLTEWKRLPGWHDAVYALAITEIIGELVPVLHAQVKQAKDGSLPHAQWVFDVAGKWTPKQRVEATVQAGVKGYPSELIEALS